MIELIIILSLPIALLVGLSYLIGRFKSLAILVIVMMTGLTIWAVHYRKTLTAMGKLDNDHQWHLIYMNAILLTVPISVIVGCTIGFLMLKQAQQKQIMDDCKL